MTLQRLWSALAVDTCVSQGVRAFFLAPGSRCTPLTLAVAQRTDCQVVQHFDERGLAFAALGYGRAAGLPAVFICTSGTAVANALPAVVEAANDGVPLLLFTADRPPELRDVGANQTIDQVGIFGRHVHWFFDVPAATREIPPSFVRSQVAHAIECAAQGPVHLNFMFREPFTVADAAVDLSAHPHRGRRATTVALTAPRELPGGKMVVMVGGCRPETAEAAREMADRLGAPLLEDVTSGGRATAFDLVLSRTSLSEQLCPETVLHVGGRMVSKNWLRFVQQFPPRNVIHLTESGLRSDPGHLQVERWVGPAAATCRQIRAQRPCSPAYLECWREASERCRGIVDDELAAETRLSEPAIAHALSQWMKPNHGLFLGNSMPIRDMDRFGFWRDRIRVGANRGASGIDGLIASACGFARGLGRPTTVLLGDLAALHDLNSLAMLRQAEPPLIVVIVNNHGGGIFDRLPIARQTRHFERYFVTPHDYDFAAAAKMFRCRYERPETLAELAQAYGSAVEQSRTTILEVHTDRELNQAVRARIQRRIDL